MIKIVNLEDNKNHEEAGNRNKKKRYQERKRKIKNN